MLKSITPSDNVFEIKIHQKKKKDYFFFEDNIKKKKLGKVKSTDDIFLNESNDENETLKEKFIPLLPKIKNPYLYKINNSIKKPKLNSNQNNNNSFKENNLNYIYLKYEGKDFENITKNIQYMKISPHEIIESLKTYSMPTDVYGIKLVNYIKKVFDEGIYSKITTQNLIKEKLIDNPLKITFKEIVLTKILDNVISHCIEIRDKNNKFITREVIYDEFKIQIENVRSNLKLIEDYLKLENKTNKRNSNKNLENHKNSNSTTLSSKKIYNNDKANILYNTNNNSKDKFIQNNDFITSKKIESDILREYNNNYHNNNIMNKNKSLNSMNNSNSLSSFENPSLLFHYMNLKENLTFNQLINTNNLIKFICDSPFILPKINPKKKKIIPEYPSLNSISVKNDSNQKINNSSSRNNINNQIIENENENEIENEKKSEENINNKYEFLQKLLNNETSSSHQDEKNINQPSISSIKSSDLQITSKKSQISQTKNSFLKFYKENEFNNKEKYSSNNSLDYSQNQKNNNISQLNERERVLSDKLHRINEFRENDNIKSIYEKKDLSGNQMNKNRKEGNININKNNIELLNNKKLGYDKENNLNKQNIDNNSTNINIENVNKKKNLSSNKLSKKKHESQKETPKKKSKTKKKNSSVNPEKTNSFDLEKNKNQNEKNLNVNESKTNNLNLKNITIIGKDIENNEDTKINNENDNNLTSSRDKLINDKRKNPTKNIFSKKKKSKRKKKLKNPNSNSIAFSCDEENSERDLNIYKNNNFSNTENEENLNHSFSYISNLKIKKELVMSQNEIEFELRFFKKTNNTKQLFKKSKYFNQFKINKKNIKIGKINLNLIKKLDSQNKNIYSSFSGLFDSNRNYSNSSISEEVYTQVKKKEKYKLENKIISHKYFEDLKNKNNDLKDNNNQNNSSNFLKFMKNIEELKNENPKEYVKRLSKFIDDQIDQSQLFLIKKMEARINGFKDNLKKNFLKKSNLKIYNDGKGKIIFKPICIFNDTQFNLNEINKKK